LFVEENLKDSYSHRNLYGPQEQMPPEKSGITAFIYFPSTLSYIIAANISCLPANQNNIP
jgi:hypothetical protein